MMAGPASDDLHIAPIEAVEVGSLICTCGMCGAAIEIDYDALDQETGRLDVVHAYGHCPDCDTPFDATQARFTAQLEPLA